MNKTIKPFTKKIKAEVVLPGSKSISNRVLLYSTLAGNTTKIKGLLQSEDTEIMQKALRNFWQEGEREIYCGNAGTATRFLVAASALRRGETLFHGTERMHSRPIEPLLQALQDLGVSAESVKQNGCLPVRVQGTGIVCGGEITVDSSLSSQFVSALLTIAPLTENGMVINIKEHLVSEPYLLMTMGLLAQFEIKIDFDGQSLHIEPQVYQPPQEFQIEGDMSAASHLWGLCAAVGGKLTLLPEVAYSMQGDAQFVYVLERMGCTVQGQTVQSTGQLKPLGEINLADMPDAAMTAVVLSALAHGKSKITGLSTLRHKECDRLSALATELTKMGASVEKGADYLLVDGKGTKSLHGATIATYNDHRMAMCFAILGAVVEGVVIQNPDCVQKTFPKFWSVFNFLQK